MDQLILASKSPRRREILEKINIPYFVYEADIDENVDDKGDDFESFVIDVSKRKVDAVAPHFSSGLVLGVDTVVVFRNRILGKPCAKYCRLLHRSIGCRARCFSRNPKLDPK